MKKNYDSLFIVFVLTVVLTLVSFSAYGADKLVVKDSLGTTDVFKVDDSGNIYSGGYIGIGTTSLNIVFLLPMVRLLTVHSQ
jgi:hypothetical protein